MKNLRIYYAHSIATYNSKQEERDIKLMEQLGWDVVNPNKPEHDAGYKRDGMDYFRSIVEDCDAVVFRANPDGSIPAGVAKEIDYSKIAFELPANILRRTLSVEETRLFLQEQGAR